MMYTCYYCNTRLPSKQIKRCSRCLLVTYCSKECQTASWKTSHKHHCIVHPSLVSPDDPNKLLSKDEMPKQYSSKWLELQVDRELSRWMQLWRSCFQQFATFALDLANHPPDRVVTHCMQLIVQPRNWEDDHAKQYQIMNASIARFSEIQNENPNLLTTHIDPTDLTRLRYVVIMQNIHGEFRRLRLLQWNDGNVDFYRNKMDKVASAALATGWEEALVELVWTGDTDKVEKIFNGKGNA